MPLVPETVQIGPSVQQFEQPLEYMEDNTGRRRSARLREKDIERGGPQDYKQIHEHSTMD